MRKLWLLSLLFFVSPQGLQATNIILVDFAGSFPTIHNPVITMEGTVMPNGTGLIRIGYFNTAAQSATWLQDLQSFSAARVESAMQSFIPVGENAATPNLGAVPAANVAPRFTTRMINGVSEFGRLAGSIQNVNPVQGLPNSVNAGGVPAGSRIFLLVARDPANPWREFGVFSADNWLMPSDPSLPLPLNTTDIGSSSEVFVGNLPLRLLSQIPEPGTASVLLFTCLGAMLRRRRS